MCTTQNQIPMHTENSHQLISRSTTKWTFHAVFLKSWSQGNSINQSLRRLRSDLLNPKFASQKSALLWLKSHNFSETWPSLTKYTYLQNKRMRRCGVPPPPPIIFERLKLPQQIIYRRKENLSESPHHQKYWGNILVSRFYEQFSRNRRNLGHFRKFEKISNSQNMNILYIILKHVI